MEPKIIGTAAPRAERARLRSLALSRVPSALADLHARLPVGALARIELPPPRRAPITGADLLVGAGFIPVEGAGFVATEGVLATRARTLPDLVAPHLGVLVCGLNPSVYAADAGIGFARPGNRFWPAARAAGLLTIDRDGRAALREQGVGMTDLVKRATPRAEEISPDEFALGLARVERLVRWLRPRVVLFVGLAGWRAVVDRRAKPGFAARSFGGRPLYLMPSTSGLNSRTPLSDLAAHITAAIAATATERHVSDRERGLGQPGGGPHREDPSASAPRS